MSLIGTRRLPFGVGRSGVKRLRGLDDGEFSQALVDNEMMTRLQEPFGESDSASSWLLCPLWLTRIGHAVFLSSVCGDSVDFVLYTL